MDKHNELAKALGEALLSKGWLLSTAESCTGGLVAGAITSVSGSSQWYDRGFVTYTNEAKIDLLDLDPLSLEKYGAVSEQTAIQMAEGVLLKTLTSNFALSTTGIAGPTGATDTKPVGMVCFAFAYRTKEGIVTRPYVSHFEGDRSAVRDAAVDYALREAIMILNEI